MPTNELDVPVGNYPGQPVAPQQNHDIAIKECLNGFVIRIGCQNVVFETKEKMLSELSRYLSNRKEVEKEYLEKKNK